MNYPVKIAIQEIMMYPTISGLDEAQTRMAIAAIRDAVGSDGNIARWNTEKKLTRRIHALDEILDNGPTPGGLRSLAQAFLRSDFGEDNDEVLTAAAILLRTKYLNDLERLKAETAAARASKRRS